MINFEHSQLTIAIISKTANLGEIKIAIHLESWRRELPEYMDTSKLVFVGDKVQP